MTDCQKNLHQRDFESRRTDASTIRDQQRDDAFDSFDLSLPETNNDEQRFKQIGFPGFASFTKALSHNADGLVNAFSFESLLNAIQVGTQEAFEQVQLGGGDRLLVNPLNAYSFQSIGNDSNGARMAAAPAFDSRNTAVDMVERYWMALCRDIRFDQYTKSLSENLKMGEVSRKAIEEVGLR